MKYHFRRNKGFTLMELLIVIAIIVVLVAIAIPVFKGQITKANETADIADIRACYAEHQEAILTDNETVKVAMDAVNNLDLNYSKKLGSSGNATVTYTADVIENNGSHTFSWTFETSNNE